jgi:hypothetical protein
MFDAGHDAHDAADADDGPYDSGGGQALYGAPVHEHEPFVTPIP